MSRSTRQFDEDQPQAGEVAAALDEMGWRVPVTPEQVAAAEAWAGDAPLPEAMADPAAAWSRANAIAGGHVAPLAGGGGGGGESAMARAAREAGHLTPEIQQRMRRDRRAAEKRMDDADGADER